MSEIFGTLGKRVRILRQDMHLQQKELARRAQEYGVDVSPSSISRIEADRIMPSATVVAALARALGTTTDYLLLLSDERFADEEEEPRVVREDPTPYEVGELAEIMIELPAEDRNVILEMARLLRGKNVRIIG